MECPIGKEQLTQLQMFISVCSAQPQILNMPQLSFFKNFIEQMGGKVPEGDIPGFAKADPRPESGEPNVAPERDPTPEPESAESDVELDMEGVVEPDNDPPLPYLFTSETVAEEKMDEASALRSKGQAAYAEQKYDEAIEFYTQAILLNPLNALFYAKRGQTFIKLVKPNACIRDCNKALELNCDSAAAYKFRGRAHRLLGNWEEAAKDLRQAVKLDYDEEADEWLKEVTPNARKLEQHRIKQERRKAEKELKARQERVRRAQEANKKAHQEQERQFQSDSAAGGGGGMPNMGDFLKDADVLNAFNDPEVAAAMQDIMANPSNVMKYQTNPKIMKLISKLGSAMGGPGGMPGFGGAGGAPGFPGGFPGGMPGGFGGPGAGAGASAGADKSTPKPPSSTDFHDDGLD